MGLQGREPWREPRAPERVAEPARNGGAREGRSLARATQT
jgi:hypothetical protein